MNKAPMVMGPNGKVAPGGFGLDWDGTGLVHDPPCPMSPCLTPYMTPYSNPKRKIFFGIICFSPIRGVCFDYGEQNACPYWERRQ